MMDDTTLPADLDERGLTRFDDLNSRNLLVYAPTVPEYISDDNGFQFQFRISPALTVKPIQAANDPGRTKASGPFSNPEPEFVISPVGPSHLLQLSKYCMLRPSYVLHPKVFATQTTDLDDQDLTAAWTVMNRLQTPHFALYNCGVEAGSSQGHKHMQILSRPGSDFDMFPDRAELPPDEPTCLSHIPFIHWVIALPKGATARDVINQHRKALSKAKESLKKYTTGTAYNVLFVKEWLIVIPRVAREWDGAGTNAAGMMGLVWLSDVKERHRWTELGLSKHLGTLGIPNSR